jgi:translation initiation factor 1
VITGVPLAGAALEELATRLKKRCGSGGTVTGTGAIEIQGDHRDTLVAELGKLGWPVKRAGG